ncbi:MAG: hypothetical protein J2P25_20885 [Nocardiopsaceae bacterium]|nr:hypothetical protein [Nocardiopsaceae bacterium]
MRQSFADVDAFNDKVISTGAFVFAGGLRPVESATTVRRSGGDFLVTDGPYLETKEHLGGFWVLEAADLDAALALAREATVACRLPVEVRPFAPVPAADAASPDTATPDTATPDEAGS